MNTDESNYWHLHPGGLPRVWTELKGHRFEDPDALSFWTVNHSVFLSNLFVSDLGWKLSVVASRLSAQTKKKDPKDSEKSGSVML